MPAGPRPWEPAKCPHFLYITKYLSVAQVPENDRSGFKFCPALYPRVTVDDSFSSELRLENGDNT